MAALRFVDFYQMYDFLSAITFYNTFLYVQIYYNNACIYQRDTYELGTIETDK